MQKQGQRETDYEPFVHAGNSYERLFMFYA